MKKNYYALWAGILFFISNSIYAQHDSYYYSGGSQIELQKDLSVKVLHFENQIPKELSELKLSGLEKIVIHENEQRAIFYFETDRNANFNLSKELNISPNLIKSEIFGNKLEDDFKLILTHHVIVAFEDGLNISNREIRNYLSTYNAKPINSDENQTTIEVQNPIDGLMLSNALLESGLANWALPDFYAEATLYNDPFYPQQFQLNNTGQSVAGVSGVSDMDSNAPQAWGINNSSSSVTVAVIDDGLEAHEDLKMSNGTSRVLSGYAPINGGNGNPTILGKHGMAVAGIIAASHNSIGIRGMAPNVKLRSVNIFHGGESTQKIAQGITWAKNNGADIMNNSWGYSSCIVSFDNINNAISDARANGRNGKGCIFVFASGNGYKSCVDYPANIDEVLSVGAFTNMGAISNYSNRGSDLDVVAPSNAIFPQTGAGVRTIDRMGTLGYSFNNYTMGFGGTSAACPVVSGVAALVISENPDLTESEVRNIIKNTATDMGTSGFDNTFGHGRVNAYQAVLQAGNNVDNGDSDEEEEDDNEIVSCNGSISSFPFVESFESPTSSWAQSTSDNLNWRRNSGSTPTSNTGPGSAEDGSYYMFIESSAPNFPAKSAALNSPCLNLTGINSPELNFSYHMFGPGMGSLKVKASTDGENWVTLWTQSGNKGNTWRSKTIDLSAYSTESQLRLKIEGITGSNFNSDMAIDKIVINGAVEETEDNDDAEIAACANSVSAFPYNEGFESGLGLWSQISDDDINWTRKSGTTPSVSTGPSSASEGNYYMFVEATAPNFPSKNAIIESPCLNLNALNSPHLSIKYNMNGAAMGTLKVSGSTDGDNWITLWSISGDQGQSWKSKSIDLSSYSNASEFKVRIEGVTGLAFSSDMAIDHIEIKNGSTDFEEDDSTAECENVVNNFPYNEGFESGTGLWSQINDDNIDWTRKSGSTPSVNTGPNSAVEGNFYMFVEATAPNFPAKNATIESPCFNINSLNSPKLILQYHMYGSGIGSLKVLGSTDGDNWTTLWSKSGSQGQSWKTQSIDLGQYADEGEFRIRIEGVTGNNFSGDMAVDNIQIINENTPPANNDCDVVEDNFPYSESFESGIGSWTQNTNDDVEWTRKSGSTPTGQTGPSAAANGSHYLYLESSYPTTDGDQAILTSACFDLNPANSADFSFQYHMFGRSTGSLQLQISEDGGSSWSNIWSEFGNRGNTWRSQSVSLMNYLGNTQLKLRFVATSGISFSSDIAIDDIQLQTGNSNITTSCPVVNFNDYNFQSFGVNQDYGTHSIKNAGKTTELNGNSWKSINFNYSVTPNTMLEFEFKSSSGEGEIHGIGFGNEPKENPSTTFRVYGTQNWGISNYANYNGSGWRTYVIPAGQYFTGNFDRLVFANDDDDNNGTDSQFRNVKIYEAGDCGFTANLALLSGEQPIIGMEEDEQMEISIYPNPVLTDFNIHMNTTEPVQITIYDVQGKIVYQAHETGNTHRVSAGEFSSGMYSVAIQDKEGNISNSKFMKSR